MSGKQPSPLRDLIQGLMFSITVLLVLGGGLYWFFDWFLGASCQNKVISEIDSPDHHYKAIVFQRDCGATTGFSTQVSVLPAWFWFGKGSGNVFIADTNHGEAPSGPGGGPYVQVEWRSPTNLVIAYHPKARTFLMANQSFGVSVEYAKVSP